MMTTSHTTTANNDLFYQLKRLGMGGAILHIGVHPDDEDVGMMAYMARKMGVRVVYWSATRGEGGQNRIGPYLDEALGVYRTWESLNARAADGGEALFGPFVDFGFSKHGKEGLNKWGKEALVREIVRAVRDVQPQIVISRWQGTADDGHGHHQAVGMVVAEAIAAAADSRCFPDLQLPAWRPQKLYYSVFGDWQPGEEAGLFGQASPELEAQGAVGLNAGEFDQILGRTYREIAWAGFNSHQTQGMPFVPEAGDFYYYYFPHEVKASPEDSLFDGLDPLLTGLAEYPGECSIPLRQALAAIQAKAREAQLCFRVEEPLPAARPLLEGITLLRWLRNDLWGYGLGKTAVCALHKYLTRRLVAFEEAAAACLGLRLDGQLDDARITPGQELRVDSRLWNHRNVHLDQVRFRLKLPAGWESHLEMQTDKTAVYRVTASQEADLTCPYWLKTPSDNPYRYHVSCEQRGIAGRPFAPPLVRVDCTVLVEGHELKLREMAVLREGFAGGYRELPLAVVPPISLHPKTKREMVKTAVSAQTIRLQLVARSNTEHTGVSGTVHLAVPDGWKATPGQASLEMGSVGDAQTLYFDVVVPANTPSDNYKLHYGVVVDGRTYSDILEPVRMGAPGIPCLADEANCIKETFITEPADVVVQLMDIEFAPNLRYAYVTGASDTALAALAHFQLDITVLDDEAISFADLSRFSAVIIGPNAYLVRDELAKNSQRFLDYAAAGGTLIVQYQGYGYQGKGFTPYPFRYNQPHDRVTYEEVPVTLLQPEHPLLTTPNRLTQADFDDWVLDRGLYFFGEWDEQYQPLLACNDPGEEPKQGGLLVAPYGQGTYIYAAYSYFRQLPAGITGAFRFFANLLAAPSTSSCCVETDAV
ncbi:MAG: PIG-L family deacetylase [Chloroflexota bacterium]